MRRSTVLGVVLLGLVASGCGAGSVRSPSADPLPDGMIRVVAKKAGLSLAIDQNWTIADPLPGSDLAFGASPAIAPLSSPIPVAGVAGATYAGFSSQSVAIFLRPNKRLPTHFKVHVPGGRVRTTIEAVKDVSTPVGKARLYVLRVRYEPTGPPVFYSEELFFLDLGRGTTELIANGRARAAADKLMAATIPTLRKVG